MVERSLAEEALAGVVDTTVEPTPEGFDIEAFIAGVRPTRRSVKLYPHAHLVARMEQIATELDSTPDGPEADALIDEFERIRADFEAGVWFTVEKRSSEWVDAFRADAVAALKITTNTDGEPTDASDKMRVLLRQLAAQIVEPAGVTAGQLEQIGQANEGELNKLIVAMTFANEEMAQSAKVLTLDFSSRRSAPISR